MADGARLNHDVLLQILTFADWYTLCVLMRTCGFFNHHGPKYILQSGVHLSTELAKDIASFMRFVESRDTLYRLSHIHTLTVSAEQTYYLGPDAATNAARAGKLLNTLFLLLARADNLRLLVLEDTEGVLGLRPDLAESIAMVGSVKTLRATVVGPRGAKMLKTLRSTLTHADLMMFLDEDSEDTGDHNDVDEGQDNAEETSPIHLLHGSQQSLRELSMAFAQGTRRGPRYLCMARLDVQSIDKPRTRHYVHAFPNLQHLSASTCNVIFPLPIGEFERLRSTNRREQRLDGSWSSLRSYDGPISTLYLLGPSCYIRSLRVDDKDAVRKEFEYPTRTHMLRSILDSACPQHLHLSWTGGRCLLDDDFLSIWTRPTLTSLTHLHLNVTLVSGEDGEDGDGALNLPHSMDNLVSRIVAPLRSLRSFWLTLSCSSFVPSRFGVLLDSVSLSRYPLVPFERALVEWDMDAFAHRVRAAGAPGPLQSVILHMRGHRARDEQIIRVGPVYKPDDASTDDGDFIAEEAQQMVDFSIENLRALWGNESVPFLRAG